MRTFDLKDGARTLTLDETGQVTSAGSPSGTWTTNAANQIVVTKPGGATTAFDVGWRFDANNHLCIDHGGAQVYDLNGDGATKPSFRLDRSDLLVRPLDALPFEFALHPKWDLTKQHDLTMTVNGVTSAIDGVINDRNSAFRFRFVDKLDVIETFSLVFKGAWKNSPDPANPAGLVYEYEIAGAAAPGVFVLPNSLVIDNHSTVLAYNYDKAGHTHSIQLVGQFSFTNFELSFGIERKTADDGTATTLRFDVDVKGRSAEGKVVFVLKRTDTGARTTTELAIGGSFTARFKNGTLVVGLSFSQRTISGTMATRDITFTGKLVHKGGTEFSWELKAGINSTTITIAADHIRLGAVTGSTLVTLKMKDGKVSGVRALLGVTF